MAKRPKRSVSRSIPPATAAVIFNPDLLLEIFEHLSPFPEPLTLLPQATTPIELPESSSLHRRTLLSAALTCRAFAEPASSVLWRVLYNGLLALFCPFSGFKIGPKDENRVTSTRPYGTLPPVAPRRWSPVTRALRTGGAQLLHLIKYISCSTINPVKTARDTHTIWDRGARRVSQARTSSEELSLMIGQKTRCILEETATPAEWERWKHCARRVRCLVLNHTWGSLFTRPFIPFLLQGVSPGEPLLPRLQSLAFNDTLGGMVRKQLLHAVLSPTLSAVTILTEIPNSFSAHVSKDLQTISESCEYVHTISLQGSYSRVFDLRLTRFRRLRVLHVNTMSRARVRSLAAQAGALEELQELRVHVQYSPVTVDNVTGDLGSQHPSARSDCTSGASTSRFAALLRLDISGMAHDIIFVLSSISSTSLWDVQIYSVQDTLADVSALVLAFPWRRNASSLRWLSLCLSIEIFPVEDGADHADVPFLDLFAPVADMHALEGLEITAWNRLFAMPDAAVAQMAQAWPHLQHLRIACNPWFQHALPDAALPSLLALVRLTERCPRLAYCELNVASVSGAELEALAGHAADSGRVPQASLEQLVPAWLTHNERFTVPDVERVARALRALFPSIGGVGEADPNDFGWRRAPWRRAVRTSWPDEHQKMDAFRLLERLNELAGKRRA